MYNFRDCYFDQQVAYGVAHASIAPPPPRTARRRMSRPSQSRRGPRNVQGSLLDFITPFVCIGLTFGLGLMVLDVLGLEHLAQPPSFEGVADGLAPHVDYVRTLVQDATAKIPTMVNG